MRSIAAILLLAGLTAFPAFAQAERSSFIRTSDGVLIHYVEAGKGKPLVFIPGWMMPGWIWQKQLEDLSRKYRVIEVDPRSQGLSGKPGRGHLPQDRARDYKELVQQLGLEQPVLIGWSMGCGELLSYVEQFGEDGVAGLVLVDGLIPPQQNPQVVSVLTQWTQQLQQDRQQEADVFVRAMYKKPQPADYMKKVRDATLLVPADSAVALIDNMLSVADFTGAFAKIKRPLLFAYEPALQPNADFLKAALGSKVRLERFDDAGHALFVDDPVRFNRMLEQFVQSLPRQ